MEGRILVAIIFFGVLFWDFGLSIRWLSLQHSNLHWNLSSISGSSGRGIRSGIRSPCGVARRRYGLAKLQAKLCRTSMDTMPHVQRAALLASETCQSVFEDRRWNCSSIITAPLLSPDLTRATREQAYVYAISSAALTYTMARACSSGALYRCTCAPRPGNEPPAKKTSSSDQVEQETFQWGGCGDNIDWGIQFSKKFIDNVEKNNANKTRKWRRDDSLESDEERKKRELKKEVAMINLHNNRVGRKVIVASRQVQCKCHGVSGSCSIKTCWRGLPAMLEIGQRLLRLYTNALEAKALVAEKKLTPGRLLYISRSPDYCTKDQKLGSLGTIGRRCNVTSHGTDSCRQLCCNRGYRTLVEEKLERCQCKYYYCCYVKCNICRTKTQIYECS